MLSQRKHAQKEGYMTYIAEVACDCGGHERYTVSGVCLNCHSPSYPGKVSRKTGDRAERALNAQALRDARARGLKTYRRSTPCGKCFARGEMDSVLRYATNGGCVACQKAKAREQHEMRKQQFGGASALISPSFTDCNHASLLRQIMPELDGQTLVYTDFDHPWPRGENGLVEDPLIKYPGHSGKCICCHPDRAIGMLGALERNFQRFGGQLDLHSEKLLMQLRRANSVTLEYPHGFLQWCMGQEVLLRAGPKKAAVIDETTFDYRKDKGQPTPYAPPPLDPLSEHTPYRRAENLYSGAAAPTKMDAAALAELDRLSRMSVAASAAPQQVVLPLPTKGNDK